MQIDSNAITFFGTLINAIINSHFWDLHFELRLPFIFYSLVLELKKETV